MTVPSTARRAGPFTGSGSLVSYPFTFKIFEKGDVQVTIADTNGIETVLTVDSTVLVTVNVDQDATPGGSVQYAVGGVPTALPLGYTLVITSEGLQYEQTADLPTGGNFSAIVVENALDRQMMLTQNLRDSIGRVLQLSATSPTSVDPTLPQPEAGSVIGWNPTATALQNFDPATFAGSVAFGTARADQFTGNGTQTAFTLAANPGALANLDVSISGVTQRPTTDYTWSAGTTLTFTTAPPNTAPILVRYMQALPQGTSDAASASYVGSGTGAVTQTVQDRLRGFMLVSDFPVTPGGVIDSTVGVTAAVAAAKLAGADLWWPGFYLTTASIPDLHTVRHFGPGGITVESRDFHVAPKDGQSNTLFVDPAASSTEFDGLSQSTPFKTFQAAFDALANYGPVLDGQWYILAAAGTYTISAASENHYTPSRNRVIVKGPDVGGHPNVPTAIIDGGGIQPNYKHGLNFEGPGVRAQVQNIKFQNFKSAGNTRVGCLFANGAEGYTINVHTFDCSWTGLMFKECEAARVTSGIFDGNNIGSYACVMDSTRGSYGYDNSSSVDGPQVKNCVSAGVYWSTGSQGHIDQVQATGNGVAVLIAENSRADIISGNYDVGANKVGIRAITGGMWGSGGVAPTFTGVGTYIEAKAYSGNIDELDDQGSGSWQRVAFDRVNRVSFGFDPTTTVNTGTDTITETAHTLATGDSVRYANGGGTDIGGLTNGTTYWAILVDANNFKLATSLANALAGTAIDLTSVGTGTAHTISENAALYTIAANRLSGVGKSCRVHAMGVMTTLTASSVVTVNFGGLSVGFTVPAAASGVAFEVDIELLEVAGGYRAIGRLSQGLNATRFATASGGFTVGSAQGISISVTTTSASDLVNIYRTDVFLIG